MATRSLIDQDAASSEPPFDPARRIIDAHHHLWHDNEGVHGTGRFLHSDLLSLIGGHNVVGTVYVESSVRYRREGPEPLRCVGETAFAAEQAEAGAASRAPIRAIVAHADMTDLASVQSVLDAHAEAGRGLFRGIRQLPTARADDRAVGLLDRPELRDGLRILGRNGYTFDVVAIHLQLGKLTALVADVPETMFVVNHLGMPLFRPGVDRRADVMAFWRRGMEALAAHPNVTVKLGGIGMDERFGTGWRNRSVPPDSDEVAAWWSDDLRWCIDTFGPERCLFESNFPVDGASLGYTVLWNAFQKIAAIYGEADQDALFARTAERVYRIAAAVDGEAIALGRTG